MVAVSCGCVVARRGSVQIYYKVTNLCYNLVCGCAQSYVSDPVPGVLGVTKITYFLYTSATHDFPTTNNHLDWPCRDKKCPSFFRNVIHFIYRWREYIIDLWSWICEHDSISSHFVHTRRDSDYAPVMSYACY